MKRLMLVLMSVILLSSAAPAQTEPPFARLQVELWPEYDRPAVLVMLQAWVAADATLPAAVRLPMPAQAGSPHAVAKRGADGALVLARHTVDVKGDWSWVNLITDVREVRLEYYVDLATTDPARRYVFKWPGGLDVAQVNYTVMQPMGATDFSVEPPPSSQSMGNDGLTYHLSDLGPKARNEPFSIAVAYTKATPTLTTAPLAPSVPPVGQMPPAGTTPGETPSGSGGTNIWLLALMLVLGAAIGGFWVFVASKRPKR